MLLTLIETVLLTKLLTEIVIVILTITVIYMLSKLVDKCLKCTEISQQASLFGTLLPGWGHSGVFLYLHGFRHIYHREKVSAQQ